ncbi:tripartite-type tricarboxylate transporter receptor subunit TctC [Advenella incenata]|uniref:Tripartite-type tricarboxylate transporter receptor subunit TctC n=1 Tax=Advenella incenata TaxID=267800 RepID=A0A4Q7VQ31_9BURK|nr:tripartite tricarboxylate transporter substrate binding protein [Advenella incenata]RZT98307.1 tripartite-type tricarboxylate transporter receptor subunit TctC [Advenella incenata]
MHNSRRLFLIKASLTTFAALTFEGVTAAGAASFPEQPVHLYIPYPPGAASDTLGRMVADVFAKAWGQPVVVENRGGGGTIIGTRAVASSKPDGYTIGMVDSAFTINPGLRAAELPYDTLNDFLPISLIATAPFVLVVHPSVKATDIKSFIELAKANPGKLTYASPGVGTAPHLAGEQLQQQVGIKVQHIPYRGGGTVFTDLLGGQVDFAFATAPTLREYIVSGRLRAIATTSHHRITNLPKVPTFEELGFPGVDTSPMFGLIGPANVPTSIVEQFSKTIADSVKSGGLGKKLADLGFDPVGSSSSEFETKIRNEIEKWKGVIKKGSFKPE